MVGIRSQTIGGFKSLMDARLEADAKAVTDAVRTQTDILKRNWRSQIVGAGLSSRLGNTVRSKVFPATGNSMRAAGQVYVQKGSPQRILAELQEGAVITVARGRFLAIPTPNVPRGQRGINHLTPHNFEIFTGIKLRFAQNRRGTKMLVGDGIRAKNGRTFRPPTRGRIKQGRVVQTVVFYILVPQVTLKKRLRLYEEADRIGGELAQLIAERMGD